jgi:hypothetical protein
MADYRKLWVIELQNRPPKGTWEATTPAYLKKRDADLECEKTLFCKGKPIGLRVRKYVPEGK